MKRRTLLAIILVIGALAALMVACDDLITEVNEITIAGQPTADFTVSNDSGCAPLQVRFKDASSGPIKEWIWIFGDGDTLVSDTDTGFFYHTYDSIGNYTVKLLVYDSLDGEDAEVKKRAALVGQTIDSFTMSADSGCPGLEVEMRGINFAGVNNWIWTFDETGGQNGPDDSVVTHTFDTAGEFEVKLIVSGECGSTTLYDTVLIVPCAEAAFVSHDTADVTEPYTPITSGCAPLTLRFTDQSTVSDTLSDVINSWHWDFPGYGSSAMQDTTVTFPNADTIPVTLTVTLALGGTSSFTDTIYVHEPVNVVSITTDPPGGCQLPGRQFVTKFTANIEGWWDTLLWDFGDGNTLLTTTDSTPAHAYLNPGFYTVSLEARSACNDSVSIDSFPDIVIYSDSLDTPTFTVTPDSAALGDEFVLERTSGGLVVNEIWRFYVEGTSIPFDSLVNPSISQYTVKFDSIGNIEIELTTDNTCNSTDTIATITVTDTVTTK